MGHCEILCAPLLPKPSAPKPSVVCDPEVAQARAVMLTCCCEECHAPPGQKRAGHSHGCDLTVVAVVKRPRNDLGLCRPCARAYAEAGYRVRRAT